MVVGGWAATAFYRKCLSISKIIENITARTENVHIINRLRRLRDSVNLMKYSKLFFYFIQE